jgi:hypothetical protein
MPVLFYFYLSFEKKLVELIHIHKFYQALIFLFTFSQTFLISLSIWKSA